MLVLEPFVSHRRAAGDLVDAEVLVQILVEVFEAINAYVLGVVARPFQHALTGAFLRVPLAGVAVLFPRDEVIVGRLDGVGEDLAAKNSLKAGDRRSSGTTSSNSAP